MLLHRNLEECGITPRLSEWCWALKDETTHRIAMAASGLLFSGGNNLRLRLWISSIQVDGYRPLRRL